MSVLQQSPPPLAESTTLATDLVSQLETTILRYMVVSPEQAHVLALWVLHAHIVEHFDQTIYVLVTSPEKRCGKTVLLELLEQLTPRAWLSIQPSEAVTYRSIEAFQPTMLLDEVDAIFNPKSADRYEGLRAVLNAGFRRGATVPRCVGPKSRVALFNVYCAKVLAGIGTVPDTIVDRSIPIRLKRRKRSEPIERFRSREVKLALEPLITEIKAWAAENGASLADDRPELPEELNDRMQDGCEPLLAIADSLGCGNRSREALITLLSAERVDTTETKRVTLLRDIRTIFERRRTEPAIATETLLSQLHFFDGDSDWGNYFGRSLNSSDLAALLRHYEISSKAVNVPEFETTKKGYRRDDFHEAWVRYLTEETEDA